MGDIWRYLKFRSINSHLISSLVQPSVFFALPENLNDPFDCRIDLHQALLRVYPYTSGAYANLITRLLNEQSLVHKFQTRLGSVGICSFSQDVKPVKLNHAMWSHYANMHSGVCITYEFNDDFIHDNSSNIIGRAPVVYGNNVLTKWMRNFSGDIGSFLDELIRVYWTAKSTSWKKEREIRIVRSHSGSLNIPNKSVAEICFGLNTPEEDILLVKRLASDYCNCESFCRVVKGNSDFGMKIAQM